ncbi:hypothetical protein [Paenibacillus hamazuiensis]|uniref:hypothetical protein n=1 Tax=Paenibacillus hamazuiensis TaxID=2936508 RepID=UPI00200DCA53|nr:hypothetical protein [Paenibacillus hamazuiensis]
MAALPLGVLKGTTPLSLVATAGLCTALVPLGFRLLLKAGSLPRLHTALGWTFAVAAIGIIFFLFGQAG